jgi:protein-disulfide isomerase-like protein with CxxC motif
MMETLRGRLPEGPISLAAFKAMLRDQCALMLLDRPAAVAAIPALLPDDPDRRARLIESIRLVAEATGPLDAAAEARLAEIAALIGLGRAANDAGPKSSSTPKTRRRAR